MALPEDKGTYILIASVCQMKRLEIGSLGKFDIVPGFYSYVGSAFGSGGLCARIGHHLESTAAPHWHIDYLLQIATPIDVWLAGGVLLTGNSVPPVTEPPATGRKVGSNYPRPNTEDKPC